MILAPVQHGAWRDDTILDKAPKRDGQLPGDSNNPDFAAASALLSELGMSIGAQSRLFSIRRVEVKRFQAFSIRRVEVKRFQAYQRLRCLKSLAGPRFSSGSALRLSQYGIRGTRWPNLTRVLIARAESDRHKSHGELTSSIVPRGTSIHQQAELSSRP
jgi:hypothetical protein